jgi:TetR/AcrR family acrAB operon transcriptional repressor
MARRTKQDALATRTALLDAAERVFGRRGVARTSLAEIAQEAGMTRGAVYWHFKDKADLFAAMMDRVTLPLDADLSSGADTPGDPLAQLLERVRRAVWRIAQDERTQRVLEIATMMVEHVDELGSIRDRHAFTHLTIVKTLAEEIEKAAAYRNSTLPMPAEQIAEGYHAIMRGLVYGWLLNRNFDLEQTTMNVLIHYLKGVGLETAEPV